MRYTESIRVNSHDTDARGIVRPSALLRYMQEAANLQMHTLGPSNESLWDNGYAFLLSRIELHVARDLTAYETVTVQSWACESRGSRFLRCGRILAEDGTSVAEVTGVWALKDTKTGRFLVNGELAMGFTPEEPLPDFALPRLREPKATMAPCGTFVVPYTAIDRNHHMNNTFYPDLFFGALPDFSHLRLRRMLLDYRTEARFAQTLTVSCAPDGENRYFLLARHADGTVCAAASMEVERR